MTPLNQYKQSLQQTIFARGGTREQSVINLHTWYKSAGRGEFVHAFEHETGLIISGINRSAKALVEQGYPKNVNEYNGKTAWDQYYIANALIALHELDKIFDRITPVPKGKFEIYYTNIVGLLKRLLLDTLVFIDDSQHTNSMCRA